MHHAIRTWCWRECISGFSSDCSEFSSEKNTSLSRLASSRFSNSVIIAIISKRIASLRCRATLYCVIYSLGAHWSGMVVHDEKYKTSVWSSTGLSHVHLRTSGLVEKTTVLVVSKGRNVGIVWPCLPNVSMVNDLNRGSMSVV